MSTTKRDYYEVLGVIRTASAEEIKKAFRRKAKECHPDTSTDPNAEAIFKELGEAYDVLSDAQKRQVYDNYGHEGLNSSGYQPSWDFAGGFADLNDIFASFFGGGFGQQRRRGGPQQGSDMRLDLSLDFNEAAFGTHQEIAITKMDTCSSCTGSGSAPGSGPSTCNGCGGAGQIRQTTQTIIGHFTQIVTCPTCQGTGNIIVNPCSACHGQARIPTEKNLSITIPAGVDNGTRLRVAGEGDGGILGGPPGDLYVVLNIRPHPQFKRDGYHVFSSVEVTYPQLALGDEIEVATISGPERLKFPSGTQSGTIMHIKNKGIPQLNIPNKRGDHYVELRVSIPTNVGGEEKKLLEKLKEIQVEKLRKEATRKGASFMGRVKETFAGI